MNFDWKLGFGLECFIEFAEENVLGRNVVSPLPKPFACADYGQGRDTGGNPPINQSSEK